MAITGLHEGPSARRGGRRRFLLSPLLALLLVVCGGCGPPRRAPDLPEPALGADQLLVRGDAQLAAGDVEAAERTLRSLTVGHPRSRQAAQLHFQIALRRLDPASPSHDAEKAMSMLELVGSEYPDSSWASAAALVLALTRENQGLETAAETLRRQLEEIKRLDLATDG